MATVAADRVQRHTDEAVNRTIHAQMLERLVYFALHPERIEERLHHLDREWDIERALEANASTFALAGLTLGFAVDRRWLALPVLVAGFLLQHALQGWCPPLPVLRRLGFRTQREIDRERYALKALRGDFRQVEDAMERLQAVRAERPAREEHLPQ
ncbi:hypothetical protein WOC76_12925 [Methylocystis sp. IM3]|uniref:hypothetical protein n=1 Tax=unclassified Methylocystis TaxID=2625913 RepID=UPI0030FAE44B